MAGGVMTTGQTNNKGRQHKRHRARHSPRQRDYGQDFARLLPGAINRLRPAMIATGSLGAASPPNDG